MSDSEDTNAVVVAVGGADAAGTSGHCQKCNTFFGHHLYSSQMLKQYVTNIITNTIRTLPSKVG